MNDRRAVILDSTPLALLVRQPGPSEVDACQDWFLKRSLSNTRFYIPEIVVYEVRRELHRLELSKDLAALDTLVEAEADRLIVLNSDALSLAAELWADVRRKGRPTAADAALDVDVILAAQVLTAGWDAQSQTITATSNIKHVGLFVPAADWRAI